MGLGDSVTEMEKDIVLIPRESTVCGQNQAYRFRICEVQNSEMAPREQDSRYRHGRGAGLEELLRRWVSGLGLKK